MMWRRVVQGMAAAVLMALPALSTAEPVKVAWSVWTGWMPFKLMETEGFLEKRAAEYGVEIELVEFKGYMDSVQAFASEQVDACAMTSMEALQPASSGIPSVAVVINDISNGGDGVLVRNGMTVPDLEGQRILLEQFSVSHYLLTRALDKHGLSEADVTIVNTPGDDAGKAFLTDDSVVAVATWNPHLFRAQEAGTGEVVFDSTNISGEIIDLLVFNGRVVRENPKAVEATVMAWYDAMEMIANRDTRDEAIRIMADGAGTTPAEFTKMLAGTDLYTEPERAVEFFNSDKIRDTMDRIKAFSHAQELITDENFAIAFGKEGGDALLRFDPSFTETVVSKRSATP